MRTWRTDAECVDSVLALRRCKSGREETPSSSEVSVKPTRALEAVAGLSNTMLADASLIHSTRIGGLEG